MNDTPWFGILGERSHRVISIIGGGGKSSLLFYLTRLLMGLKEDLIVSTTAKMWKRQLQDIGQITPINELDTTTTNPKIPIGGISGNKVLGLKETQVQELKAKYPHHRILLEADGSKQMPLKAHREDEPPIPPCTDLVIGVVGLDCLERPIEEVVFRSEEYQTLHGCRPRDRVNLELLAAHVRHPRGLFKFSPVSAKKLLFLNKIDLLSHIELENLLRVLNDLSFGVDMLMAGSILKREFYILHGDGGA